jgi:hypothetical protein
MASPRTLRRVSDSPQAQPTTASGRISLRKPAAAGAGRTSGFTPERVAIPPLINYACIALGVAAAAILVRGLSLLGSTATLNKFLVKSNHDAKKPKSPYGPAEIAKDLHGLRQSTLLLGVISAIALVLLMLALRRTRTASATRWAMLVLMLFTSLPLYVVPIHGFPKVTNGAGVVTGVAAIAAILLIFLPPQSQRYFRDCREASTPPELRGQPRPGLFGPRRQRAGLAGPGGRAAAARAAARTNAAGTQTRASAPDTSAQPAAAGGGKARAKVRSDAESVARGADLARARAKASKSRRTPG